MLESRRFQGSRCRLRYINQCRETRQPVENATPFRAVRFGVFDLDLKAGELHKNGLKVRLQDQPFQILKMLLERPGEVVTHQEIIRRLWPNGTVVEYEHSIQTAVKKLRQALDDDAEAPRYVETLPRRGYRFIYPVNEAGVHRGVAQPPQAATETGSLPGMRRGSPDLVGKRVSRYRVLEMLGGGEWAWSTRRKTSGWAARLH